MNVTMPYQDFRSQSRVEFIKKKFENSFPEEKNNTGSLKRNNGAVVCKANFIQELKDLNLDNKIVNLKSEINDVNKNEGKALVKRSPAFRRDKLGCTKSLTQVNKGSVLVERDAQETILEEDTDVWKGFKRSKTDTNLLKHCSNRFIDTKISPKNTNPLVFSQNKDNETKNITDQYSVVNKNKTGKSDVVNLKFSESIRRALQSPLPKGPPPKKPPRTFCHAPSTKSDIPKLKSKLEKLEKVVRIHESGSFVEKKKDLDENMKKLSIDSCSDVSDTCIPVRQCLNQGTKSFRKVAKARSEFYLPIDKPDVSLLGKCFAGSASDVQVNKEAIYDLPCLTKKNSFETFGKCSKDVKESVNTKKAEGLHYMCTDVINQTPKYPTFLLQIDHRKSSEERNLSDILKISSSEEHNRRDDVKEDKDSQRNMKPSCAAGDDSSGESESDLVVTGSDSNERKKNESEGDILSHMTARRKIYVSRVTSKLMSQIPCWKYRNTTSYKHLFECCLLVGLTLCESKHTVPYIKSIFPPNTKPPPLIEFLCFPDASYWPPTSEEHHPEEQNYSLVVTNENGERKFGYCRRVLPEGGHVCLPLAYCIISPHRAGGFFYKVLEELESRHGSPVVESFIQQLYESEFPGPGERLKLKEILEEATRNSQLDSDVYLSSTLLRRPPDVRLEEKELTQLFKHLQLPVFLKVFSSLLLERKVLLLSNSLRNLSSCIEALQSILLPFSWQHTYIPVLPVHLIEMCEAPTPYVIGLLKPRNVEKSLTNVNFEDGILVDLDESKILKCCGDEGSILPTRPVRDLKTSLNLAMSSSDLLSESVKSVLISDAFIRFFVQVCGNYSKFIQSLPNGEKTFQKEEFVKSVGSNAVQLFLEWFTETAMFKSFIQERLQGEDEDMTIKLFRRRAMEYSEDSVKDSTALLKNYRVINKKVKTLGGKIKDFTSFNKYY